MEKFGGLTHGGTFPDGRRADEQQEHVTEMRPGKVSEVDPPFKRGRHGPVPSEVKENLRGFEGRG